MSGFYESTGDFRHHRNFSLGSVTLRSSLNRFKNVSRKGYMSLDSYFERLYTNF